MTLVYLGTDFHETPLARLEEFERASDRILDALAPGADRVDGAVVVATCNRFEVYFEADGFHESIGHVTATIARELNVDVDEIGSSLNLLYGDGVPQHLFAVASGLESMIVGEEEIAGQVKRALSKSQRHDRASKALNQLFQTASRVAKEVTTHTGLGASGRSVIATALDISQTQLAGLAGKKVLLIGTGAYSRVVVTALTKQNVDSIRVYSKSGRAEKFSDTHETTPVDSGGLLDALAEVDLVVSASGTPGYALDLQLIKRALEARDRHHPLSIIDVSLSRDVEPGVEELPGVTVVDLETVRINAPHEHIEALVQAQEIIRNEVRKFTDDAASRSIDPVVSALRAHIGVWVDEEVDRVRRKSGEEAAVEVERSLRKVTNAILHAPSAKAKELAMQGNHDDYIRAVRLLFDVGMD